MFSEAFSNFLNSPTVEIANELESIKRNARNLYSLLIQSRQKTNFIKSIYSEGKSNSQTYKRFKSKKSVMHKILLPDNELCTEPDALVKIFSDHHKSVTSTPVTHRDTFNDFENFFDLKIDDIFHHKYAISDWITTAELNNALKSMSAVSAPLLSKMYRSTYIL